MNQNSDRFRFLYHEPYFRYDSNLGYVGPPPKVVPIPNHIGPPPKVVPIPPYVGPPPKAIQFNQYISK